MTVFRKIVLALWGAVLICWHVYLVVAAFRFYPSIRAALWGIGDTRGLLSIDILVAELVLFTPLIAILALWSPHKG